MVESAPKARVRALLVALLAVGSACAGPGVTDNESGGTTDSLPAPTKTTTPPDPPASSPITPQATDGCIDGEALCIAHDRRRTCASGKWVEETCAKGAGCFQGTCTPGKCSDECTLGTSQGGKACTLVDLASDAPATSNPQTKLHDRARDYLGWLGKAGLLAGSVGDALFADPPAYTNVITMNGLGDSALWTGTLLASEALRLRATGAADAHARVRALAKTVHLMMRVSGEPGVLARYVKESSTTLPFAAPDMDCTNPRVHCGIDFEGKKYDFVGHISRDQYQGVMLGMALTYEALTSADEDLREQIRGDVVTFVEELMKERSLPAIITYNGLTLPVASIPIRFIVVSPSEMTGGAANISINSGGAEKLAGMTGFQEFIPNLADVVKHIPGIGAIGAMLPIPRASSAIMLSSAFRVALRVTENVPAWATHRANILAFYTGHTGEGGNVDDWLQVAKQWSDSSSNACGDGYFGNNITMMPLYTLAHLEDDVARLPLVRDTIFAGTLWPAFKSTKNSFFAFLYAGDMPAGDPSATSTAAAQLAQFPLAPHAQVPVDLRATPKYPDHQTGCTDQVTHSDAVDIEDWVSSDFLWQRQPWALYDPGDPRQTHPGVDYLVAYFLGRFHAFLPDDTAGQCLAYR